MVDKTNAEFLDEVISSMRDYERALENERPSDNLFHAYGDARDAVLSRMGSRPKLSMDATPELVAMLDGSAAREDEAREVAMLAAMLGSQAFVGLAGSPVMPHLAIRELVKDAARILDEARRHVRETAT